MSDQPAWGKEVHHHATQEKALTDLLQFPLVEAIFGRRSRRFFRGAEVPDGPLAFTSRHQPLPLDDVEKLLILAAVGGVTGWHNSVTRHDRYAPHLSNYAGSASGRTFPSAAGFHTAEIFFTDDSGTYLLETRDYAVPVNRNKEGQIGLPLLIDSIKPRIRKLADTRLHIPAREPYMEGHNTWVANRPGSLLVFPVGDLAQHTIANLFFYATNGYTIYDDIHKRKIPGIEKFASLVDIDQPYPLTFVEQYSLTELTAELSTSVYAGMLMQQALGLGGWMFDGIDRLTVLGASGDPEVPGLGFRYDTDERWSQPNPTGLAGVFETLSPPHYPDLRAAVDAYVERKFGPGGPFHPDTPGPWQDSSKVRSSAKTYDEPIRELVTLQAQYIYDTFGKFPATVPTVFSLMYLQTHHLDLEYYDKLFLPGAYLRTHADHLEKWHGKSE
ncbi:hypothetical protein BRE01_53310 [Brevibacillus reuszeri]|uniref:Uncharacterized protein n=1 Tax=Brevibacillus reuszeri TaxID=54915 RepID=A0ABQ0TUW3_9BACL|nr:hypothetical protein [Brevibacillus reuszeri]MED1860174.1 hypothetical protein [Brevibacillus reuszeri]GED71629.1 hypothetical protein BRE01_53310 [Brevibacillus reuszeri]